MERLAIKEEEKIKKLLDLKSNLNFKKSIKNSKINEVLTGKGSRIFIEDALFNRELAGTPKVGQIIAGIKFWHYQEHIGIITEVTKEKYEYTDLTLSNNSKSIALEWKQEIKEDQIELINKEMDSAIQILESFMKELKEEEEQWKKNALKKENEKTKKALELL